GGAMSPKWSGAHGGVRGWAEEVGYSAAGPATTDGGGSATCRAAAARALRAGVNGGRWKVIGASLCDDPLRLLKCRRCSFEVLVGNIDLLFQPVEHRVLVDRPPSAAVDRIERFADFPASLFVLRRHRSVGPLIIRPHRAGEKQRRPG